MKRGVGIKRAEQLNAAATISSGITEVLMAARIELAVLLEQYDLYGRQEESIMTGVMQILEKIIETKQMLSIPGIGVLTVAGFLAEVGDNYDHGLQIIRLAGLNLTENSSGKRKGKTGISKRGRSRLRGILFRAMMPMVAKNEEFQALHKYLTARSQNPLKKKQSIIALCGKLVRILYTLGPSRKSIIQTMYWGRFDNPSCSSVLNNSLKAYLPTTLLTNKPVISLIQMCTTMTTEASEKPKDNKSIRATTPSRSKNRPPPLGR